ncbi:MAG: cyclic pyranopterin monophosphate synthase MoaC, partial [Planctomycetota bacterium]
LSLASAAFLVWVLPGYCPLVPGLAVAGVGWGWGVTTTGELIPLCHPLPVDFVNVSFERTAPGTITVTGEEGIDAKTGVEMEALTAVSVACLTLYDMTKAVDKDLRIEGVRLVEKTKESI